MKSGSHYFALFLVVTIGVASGNLLSTELTARYAAYKLNEASERMRAERAEREEQRVIATALYQEELERERRERSDQAERKRAASKRAKQLLRSCYDWTEANKKLSTEITAKESDKACNAYNRYVKTGRL